MKKLYIMTFVAVIAVMLSLPAAAYAEHIDSDGWYVKFSSDTAKELEDNFGNNEWTSVFEDLQPGDDVTIRVDLIHDAETSADWYMSNAVLKSLETEKAKDGAYEYSLVYHYPDNTSKPDELYVSSSVGGRDTTGLKEAAGALKDYFKLDTLNKGDKAWVTLNVKVDGEAEDNNFFNTLAQLQMQFALELNNSNSETPETRNTPSTNTTRASNPVQTGDSTNLFPFYVAMIVSGSALMLIAIWSTRRRKRQK